MRFSFLVLMLLLPTFSAFSQKYSYYIDGKLADYTVSGEMMIVELKDGSIANTNNWQETVLMRNGVLSIDQIQTMTGVFLLKIDDESIESIEAKISEFTKEKEVSYATPFLINAEGNVIGALTNEFIVKLKQTTTLEQLKQFSRQYQIDKLRQYEFNELTFFLSAPHNSDFNSMEFSKFFYESGLFEYAEPNFMIFSVQGTTDTFYSQQWAINNTGQAGGTAGADMDVVEAWGISTGCATTRVAILDSGVELNHPDLINNLEGGFDATGAGGNGGAIGSDSHGTACAGIVAAEGDNSEGIAGIAYNSHIVPVKVLTDATPTNDVSFPEWLAAGIDWAWQNNRSEVISMSLGIFNHSQLVTDAINRAINQGRNNLGCIVLAISHNDGTASLRFPATLPNVIAVGASTRQDTKASFSNYGAGLDVVAPGVDIYVTDRQGSVGYNTSSGIEGDYFSGFTGTSAAAPQVAGIAALILSVNPTLTFQEVRNIIESTTDKVGGVTYTLGAGEQAGLTWNNQMGYGRVNAFSAVQAALPTISGPALLCSPNTFTLQDLPAGSTATWSVTPSAQFVNSSGTGSSAYLEMNGGYTPIRPPRIVFTITTACGEVEVAKTFWAGSPRIIYSPPGQDPCHANPYYSTVNVPGLTYNWSVDNPNVWLTSNGQSITSVLSNDPEYFNLTLEISDGSCTTSHTINTYTDGYYCQCFSDPSCDNGMALHVYPNPTSDQLTVELDTAGSFMDKGGIKDYELRLYSTTGNELIATHVISEKTVLDVSSLKQGFYYLHLIHKEGILRRQIRIER